MMTNPLKKSLKVKLFATIFSASVLAMSGLCTSAFFSGKSTLKKQIFDSYTTVAQSRELAAVLFLERSKEEFLTFTILRHVIAATEAATKKTPELETSLPFATALMKNFLAINTDAEEYFVMDLSGKVILSTNEKHVGMDKSNDEYFLRGQKEVHVKDVDQSPTTGQAGFVISGPLYTLNSKELIGVCGIRYNLSLINALMTDRQGMGEAGETYIVNKEGYFLTDSRFINDVTLKKKIETEPVKLWQSQKKMMGGIYSDYRGQAVLGVSMGDDLLKSYSDLGWLILVEVDAKEAFAPIRKLGFTLLLLGIMLSMLMALIAYWIAQGIAKPITAMAQVVRRIGEGDLTQDIVETKAEDEIGALSRSFQQTIVNLRNIVLQTKATTARVGAAAQQLSATAQEMNTTTEEVTSTVQQIAKGSENTAQRVEETSKVMEQMNASVTQVATSAQAAAAASVQMTQSARKGGEAAKETVEKMNKIYEIVISSAGGVKKLGQRSDEINEIVNVITNISDQTNLLALNAAIEAARAGEAGRGFAVVAEEVRKLAEGSAKAADKIAGLIKEIGKETTEAVKAMETGSKEVSEGREVVTKAGSALGEIIKLAEHTGGMVVQISAATEQMSAGTKQVVKSVDDIASTAEEAASATEEASASTEEMTASMQEMAASAQELSEMAISLRDLVGKFKVEGEASHQAIVESRKSMVDSHQKKSALRKRLET